MTKAIAQAKGTKGTLKPAISPKLSPISWHMLGTGADLGFQGQEVVLKVNGKLLSPGPIAWSAQSPRPVTSLPVDRCLGHGPLARPFSPRLPSWLAALRSAPCQQPFVMGLFSHRQ